MDCMFCGGEVGDENQEGDVHDACYDELWRRRRGDLCIFCGEEPVVWDAQACEQCQANQVYVGYSGGT